MGLVLELEDLDFDLGFGIFFDIMFGVGYLHINVDFPGLTEITPERKIDLINAWNQ